MLRFEDIEGMTIEVLLELVGGRWVLYPSDAQNNDGSTDLLIVFENLPWRFPTGLRSNDPTQPPPLQVRISRSDLTQTAGVSQQHQDLVPICVHMSPEVNTDKEWRDVVMASIRRASEYEKLHVTVTAETTVVHNGYGEISLTVADTITLYQELGKLNGLTYTGTCPECDILLDASNCCDECGEHRGD